MKVPEKHYSNYLLSVCFDRKFMPDTLSGKIEQAENFLEDLGSLARKSGKRLHATFSIVIGQNAPHVHFAVSWLPLLDYSAKSAKEGKKRIARYTVSRLLDDNYFIADNPNEAIKRVTHDKAYVTNYVIEQPKKGQTTIYSAFYIHPDFVPVCSEKKMRPYCSKRQFGSFQKSPKNHHIKTFQLLFLISAAWLILISSILTTLF